MAITNGLCTLDDVRASLNLKASDTSNDTDLERYIEAATPLIEDVVGPMYPRSETYVLSGGGAAVLLPVRFNTVSAFTSDGIAVSGYIADGLSGIISAGDAGSFATGIQNLSITVTVGYATIPPNVVLAARECVRELWQIGRQANRPSFGNEPTEASAPNGYVMSRRVRALLAPNADLAGFA